MAIQKAVDKGKYYMLGLRETDEFNTFDIYDGSDDQFYKEYGHYSCFSVERDDPKKVINGDEVIVTAAEKITVIFSYPLKGKFRFDLNKSGGNITRKDFAEFIQSTYRCIYEEERKGIKGSYGNIPGMLNRAPSYGPYGIWGHHIGDLVIEGVKRIGDNLYSLRMGS